MSSHCRHLLALAAAMSITVGPSMMSPASAAEGAVARDVARPVVAKRAVMKRDHWRVSRRAVARTIWTYEPRLAVERAGADCSGDWCGRNFVLMLGIGY